MTSGAANATSTDCSTPCAGNANEPCGNANRLNLFWNGKTPPPPPEIVPSVGSWVSLGCYSYVRFLFLCSFLSTRSRYCRAPKTLLGRWVDGNLNGLIRDSPFFCLSGSSFGPSPPLFWCSWLRLFLFLRLSCSSSASLLPGRAPRRDRAIASNSFIVLCSTIFTSTGTTLTDKGVPSPIPPR